MNVIRERKESSPQQKAIHPDDDAEIHERRNFKVDATVI